MTRTPTWHLVDHLEEEDGDVVASSRNSLAVVSSMYLRKRCAVADRSILGGKHFSRNLRPLDADGNEIGGKPSDESEEEGSEDEEESSEEEAKDKPVLSREERRAAAKAKKGAAIARKKNTTAQPGDLPSSSEEDEDSDDDMPMPANPNHSKAARNQASAPPKAVDEATEGVKNMNVGKKGKAAPELSRREREALEAQQAKERYMKLHEAGKTDEAKADLARLAVIKKKREEEAARKQVSTTKNLP